MTIIVGTSGVQATTQTAQPSSGTYEFDPSLSDLTLEALARIQVKTAQITAEHMWNCRMSANLLLSQWASRVPNLWLVKQFSIPLIQGVPTYALPSNVVTILDAFIRTYTLTTTANIAVSVTTVSGSTTATIQWAAHGQLVGNWITVQVPISIGGVVIQGSYTVSNVVDANNIQITLSSAATSSATGGVVPSFTTAIGGAVITITLPNHGLSVNSNFSVQVQTVVSNITIAASVYTVTSVISSSQFTFTATGVAGTVATVFENGGLAQYLAQANGTTPTDRVTTPISRTDYSDQPNKASQAFPSTYWFNRQISPTVTFWQVPDQNGPYVFYYYAMVQAQDAAMENGKTLDIPLRFYDAFAAGLARRLARKYAPQLVAELRLEEAEAWGEAAAEDTEDTPMYIRPSLSSYYR